jgi:crotonobetainyl-CoA:carnitine CoA-transferase CaiB-like acyl-CoA transferase
MTCLVQGMGGIMDITGDPGRPADPPRRLPLPTCHRVLFRARHHRGAEGARAPPARAVTSTWRCSTPWSGVLATQAACSISVSGEAAERMGNAHATVVPLPNLPDHRRLDADRLRNDGQFAKMMTLLGDPGMAKDERYRTNAARVVNRRHADPAAVRADQEIVEGRARGEVRGGRRTGRARSTRSPRCSPIRK